MNVINSAGDPVYEAIRRHRAAISALNDYRGPKNAEWIRLENTFFVARSGLKGFLETFHAAARLLAVRS